jgi:asparagine synthase (glutamine-hydrolysing)
MRLGSFLEYTEAFRHYFEQAVQRRLRSAYPVAISVSGGLDSSSIFCLAETLRQRDPAHVPPLLGISYTSADGTPSDEKAFLLDIEREYDTAIERLPMDSPGFMDGARDAVWHSETPDLDEQWNALHKFLSTARERGARVLLTGHWGDQILFSRAYLIDLFHRLAWLTLRAHLKEFGRWMTDADPRSIRQRFLLDLLRYHLPDTLRPFLRTLRAKRHLPWYTERLRRAARLRTPPQHIDRATFPTLHSQSLYEETRSNRHVRCMEWNNKVASVHGLEMAFPFLDRDLLSFLMSIPGEMQTWKGVPKAFLREAMRGVLPEAIVQRTWKADFTHHVNEGMQRDYPRLAQCLLTGGLSVQRGYLKEDVLRETLARLQSRIQGPTCESAWRLSALVGLELWLQVFYGKTNDDHHARTTYDPRARVSISGGTA